jgi:hypothetical protein
MASDLHNLVEATTLTGVATGAALTGGKFVQISGAGGYPNPLVQIAADASARSIGVTLGAADEDAEVSIAGPGSIVQMVAGAAGVTAGALVTPEAGATGLPINAAANKLACGICLSTAVGGATTYIRLAESSWYEA